MHPVHPFRINGLSWPHTETLTYHVVKTAHWRAIKSSVRPIRTASSFAWTAFAMRKVTSPQPSMAFGGHRITPSTAHVHADVDPRPAILDLVEIPKNLFRRKT